MSSPETIATEGAAKFKAAETAIRELAAWVQEARTPLNIPPITF